MARPYQVAVIDAASDNADILNSAVAGGISPLDSAADVAVVPAERGIPPLGLFGAELAADPGGRAVCADLLIIFDLLSRITPPISSAADMAMVSTPADRATFRSSCPNSRSNAPGSTRFTTKTPHTDVCRPPRRCWRGSTYGCSTPRCRGHLAVGRGLILALPSVACTRCWNLRRTRSEKRSPLKSTLSGVASRSADRWSESGRTASSPHRRRRAERSESPRTESRPKVSRDSTTSAASVVAICREILWRRVIANPRETWQHYIDIQRSRPRDAIVAELSLVHDRGGKFVVPISTLEVLGV